MSSSRIARSRRFNVASAVAVSVNVGLRAARAPGGRAAALGMGLKPPRSGRLRRRYFILASLSLSLPLARVPDPPTRRDDYARAAAARAGSHHRPME